MTTPDHHVAIIGGGPAGLSAALMLGRCRRRVLLCDTGRPRNARARELHGFLTRDGTPPLNLLRLGRDELRAYGIDVPLLSVPGAGVRPYRGWAELAGSGVISLQIGIHGLAHNRHFGLESSDLQLNNPQVTVEMDRDKLSTLGLTANQVETALFNAYGTRQVSQIYAANNQYQIILQVAPEFQQDPAAMSLLYVRSSSGKLVPLSTVARIRSLSSSSLRLMSK